MTDYIVESPDTPAPSPFLESTAIQYAWDSTSIGYLKRCPRLYYYKILQGYQRKGENINLRFGSEFHQACWDYDISIAEGIPHDDAVHDVVRALLWRIEDFNPSDDSKAGKYKNKNSLVRTVIYYLDARNSDVLRTYKLENGKPAVELSGRFELGFGPTGADTPYILSFHMDRVVEDPNGNLFIEDHKTTTMTPGSYFFDQFEPDNQMSLYTFAGRVVLEVPVKGVIINAVQLLLTPPYANFQRGMTYRNDDQLEEWLTDLSRWLQLAEWYAEQNYWPQNDTACDKYGGCEFRSVCSKAPNVRHVYLSSDFTQLPEDQRWNPLKSR